MAYFGLSILCVIVYVIINPLTKGTKKEKEEKLEKFHKKTNKLIKGLLMFMLGITLLGVSIIVLSILWTLV